MLLVYKILIPCCLITLTSFDTVMIWSTNVRHVPIKPKLLDLTQSGQLKYMISTSEVSGSADVHLYLYGPDYGYYARGNYVAASYNIGTMDEQIIYTPTSTSYHVIVVCKPYYTSLPAQAVYDISVGLAPPNLTYQTPAGWDFPVVPRNTAGATPSNCTLTASLPGNTTGTYLNFSTYNEGPIAIPSIYSTYIFVDSVSHYGVNVASGQPAGAYLYVNNALSANIIRGGRHTLGMFIDRNYQVIESNEDDNWYEHQFVWSPYVLSDYTPVVRSAPPPVGNGVYFNSDGFEFTGSWWGAVAILPFDDTERYNVLLYDLWIDAETGFDIHLTGSWWAADRSDFIITTDQMGGSDTYDAGVMQTSNVPPGTNSFVIHQANEQATWYTPNTYGPYTIASGEIMGVWEVYLDIPGSYAFEVDVISGNADIGTSLYDSDVNYHNKTSFFGDGISDSPVAGGDESFIISNPYSGQYFGWAVWKAHCADRTLSSTFYLTWGPVVNRVPLPVNDLVIERVDSTGAQLTWTAVTEDTSGNPLTVDYYRIHRNLDPDFTPSPGDSIGSATGTTYVDPMVIWNNPKYFYKVVAVDTD